jgi:hypothetical protein
MFSDSCATCAAKLDNSLSELESNNHAFQFLDFGKTSHLRFQK